MTDQEILTDQDVGDLTSYEAVIDKGLETFMEVGTALMAIRDRRLYRQTHGTFEQYCSERWALSRKRTYDLMDAAGAVAAMSPMGDTATTPIENERQARAIAPVVKAHGPEVAAEVLKEVADKGRVTAAAITAAAKNLPAPATPPAPPRSRSPKRDAARPKMEEYLREHPGVSRNDVAAATGIDKSMVTKIAKEIGHTWPTSGPPRTAVSKGGQVRHQKNTPPPTSTVPLYQRAVEVSAVRRLFDECQSMASNNGRMHYAQHVVEAIHAGDTGWLAKQREAAEYAAAYAADLARIHTDQAYRERLNTGWEGRDDLPEQQVVAGQTTLRSVV